MRVFSQIQKYNCLDTGFVGFFLSCYSYSSNNIRINADSADVFTHLINNQNINIINRK